MPDIRRPNTTGGVFLAITTHYTNEGSGFLLLSSPDAQTTDVNNGTIFGHNLMDILYRKLTPMVKSPKVMLGAGSRGAFSRSGNNCTVSGAFIWSKQLVGANQPAHKSFTCCMIQLQYENKFVHFFYTTASNLYQKKQLLLLLLFLVLWYVHFWLFSFQHGAKDGCATLLSVSFFLVFCYVLFLDPFRLFIPQYIY